MLPLIKAVVAPSGAVSLHIAGPPRFHAIPILERIRLGQSLNGRRGGIRTRSGLFYRNTKETGSSKSLGI